LLANLENRSIHEEFDWFLETKDDKLDALEDKNLVDKTTKD